MSSTHLGNNNVIGFPKTLAIRMSKSTYIKLYFPILNIRDSSLASLGSLGQISLSHTNIGASTLY